MHGRSQFTHKINHGIKTVAVSLLLQSKMLGRNDIREQAVQRKLLWDGSAELNAADKICKLSKNPKILALIDEILINSSIEKLPI